MGGPMEDRGSMNATPEDRHRRAEESLKTQLRQARNINTKQATMLEKALAIIGEIAPHRLAELGITPEKDAAGG